MAVRILAAAVLSAVLMFFWGFVFWGPVLNMTANLMTPLPPEEELDTLAPLRAAKLPDGMYVYPGPLGDAKNEEAVKAWEQKIAEGPVLHMAFHQQGISPMDPLMFAKGLAHSFVIALLAGILLGMVVNALPSFGSRVGLLALLSLIAAIWTNVASVIWWFHPPRYCAGQMAYELGAGLLMALVTAAMVRPRPSVLSTAKTGA